MPEEAVPDWIRRGAETYLSEKCFALRSRSNVGNVCQKLKPKMHLGVCASDKKMWDALLNPHH